VKKDARKVIAFAAISVIAAGIPATMTLIAANAITFLASFFTGGWARGGPFWWLVFTSDTWPQNFWTLITWPLVAPVDLIGLLFGGIWAYWIGSSLERAWGTRAFLVFLVALSALTALTLWMGGRLLGVPVAAQGLWLAIAAPTVAWCVLNQREVIRLYAVIPIPAPLLAWLTVALTWFQVSMQGGNPFLGAFALSGCAAAYWYAKNGRYAHRGYARTGGRFGGAPATGGSPPLRFRDFDRDPPVARGFDPVRGLRSWWQRRQLEKLWKRSGFSDPDEKNHRR
jgi:membrane associated rhomboid family serine protease